MPSFSIPFEIFFFLLFFASSHAFSSKTIPSREAEALLKWKATLPSNTQTLLSSLWGGRNHCNWTGITCNNAGSVTNMTLREFELKLSGNNIFGSIPSDIGRLSSLSVLFLNQNHLTGTIPISIGDLQNLSQFVLVDNRLNGSIPIEIGMVTSLGLLDLSNNHLPCPIPTCIGNLSNMKWLYLWSNNLFGSIPRNLTDLDNLVLNFNGLSGSIPTSMGNLNKLSMLTVFESSLSGLISNNNISRKIPFELGHATQLQELDLSLNHLNCEIPKELGKLTMMNRLFLSGNQFFGKIPSEIGLLSKLEQLDLASNNLSGPIPDDLGNCFKLFNLNLSKNNLEASIPSSISYIHALQSLDLSQNSLIGGHIPNLKAFHEASFDALRLMTCVPSLLANHGGYGSVYKAALPTGQVVAVKKLHQSEDNMLNNNLKAFESEIGALLEIRHRNIVQMYGFWSHPKHSFLVYELVERGSLRMVLTNNEQAKELDWKKRLNVVKGLANALSYMHHGHSQPIVHRDISSNNVLLDLDYEARVSDFGTARILKPDSSSCTSLAGTYRGVHGPGGPARPDGPPARNMGGSGKNIGPKYGFGQKMRLV
ncbi:hypothetical protein Gotur_025280 [Gossypium turneri]